MVVIASVPSRSGRVTKEQSSPIINRAKTRTTYHHHHHSRVIVGTKDLDPQQICRLVLCTVYLLNTLYIQYTYSTVLAESARSLCKYSLNSAPGCSIQCPCCGSKVQIFEKLDPNPIFINHTYAENISGISQNEKKIINIGETRLDNC